MQNQLDIIKKTRSKVQNNQFGSPYFDQFVMKKKSIKTMSDAKFMTPSTIKHFLTDCFNETNKFRDFRRNLTQSIDLKKPDGQKLQYFEETLNKDLKLIIMETLNSNQNLKLSIVFTLKSLLIFIVLKIS